MDTRHGRFVLVAAATLAIATGCAGGAGAAPPSRAALTTETASPSPSPSASPTFSGTVLKVAGTPIDIASAGGSLWVSDIHGDAVVRVDPVTLAAIGTVPTAAGAGPAYMVASGTDLFVAANNGVGMIRISTADGKTSGVAAPDTQFCCQPVIAGGSLWAAGEKGLTRIDPVSLAVIRTIPVGDHPDGLATDGSHVWGTNEAGKAWVVDVATNARSDLGLDGYPVGIAAGDLWVAHGQTLLRVDPTTGKVLHTISTEGDYNMVAITDAAAYLVRSSVLIDRSTIVRIDTKTNAIAGAPVSLPGLEPSAIRVIDGSLWITSFSGGSIIKLATW